MAISMLKIRRPLGRLIFNMGIAIPGKTVFLIETAPRAPFVRGIHVWPVDYSDKRTSNADSIFLSWRHLVMVVAPNVVDTEAWSATSQFPHLAIAVSPRLEVKSSGHTWLDGCNFQRKRLLAPTGYAIATRADRREYRWCGKFIWIAAL